jgi:anthranilate synthase component 2
VSGLLVLDNYDSFTYNLVHYLEELTGERVSVFRNDEITLEEAGTYDRFVFSPGPGLPEDAGILLPLIKRYAEEKPMLGVCLGHQALAMAFGGSLKQLSEVLHGLQRDCLITEAGPLYNGMEARFSAGRYHSWVVDKATLPDVLRITAVDELGEIMSLQHEQLPLYGVQFHPESIMTPGGKRLLKNWLAIS